MNHICIKNCEPVAVAKIPTLGYDAFREEMLTLMAEESNHIAAYFAMPTEDGRLRIVGCIAEDSTSDIAVSSATVEAGAVLPALSAEITAFERFEREIAENSGITFEGHPWPKPLRTAPDNYPFFDIKGEELHQVGVGPIHAGVIEPGHFRFICNGEKILHLEIMLGYQHRGLEKQFIGKTRLNQRALLAESIAGDTAVSHSVAFADAWEALCGVKVSERCRLERMLASELERIAIHTGDLSAICGDVAYQLGSAVYGRLRTPIINFMQCWCGNRLGKGCVRPFSQPYPFTSELAAQLETVLARYRRDFEELSNHLKRFPPVLSRLERTGVVTRGQAVEIGAVGMAAKASGLSRDIRHSHPYLDYACLNHTPVVKRHGDVYSRTQVRIYEVLQSLDYAGEIARRLQDLPCDTADYAAAVPAPDTLVVSLSEGWRGEICHVAATDAKGNLLSYKIKDPSFHNWMALALAVRGNEISDFPICNKSFNLSYCGHDL